MMIIYACSICSASNKEMYTAPQTGFFYNFKSKEVLVKKWDAYNEGNRHCEKMLLCTWMFKFYTVGFCQNQTVKTVLTRPKLFWTHHVVLYD